ncbi:MAG: HAD-IIA family hydrolase [Candidatus Verstraetearchaeota archaeon]|nr:HAD-IIA family hydrolase [Candidatus Verstraetearchaeota archaeon]
MTRKLDFKAFILDLDGNIYRGDRPVEGAAGVIDALRKKGKKVLFLTNNSTRTPQEYTEKLRGMGIETSPEEILTSSIATAIYMRNLERGGVYVVGEAALKSAIAGEGFTLLDEEGARRAKYVVCGLDSGVTYRKLAAACLAIQGGAKFIAANTDRNLPVEGGYLPGAGAIVGAIVTATGAKPIIVGKPSKNIMGIALKRLGVGRGEVAMVGDCLDIDVAAGRNAGVYTILVLTGVTCRSDLRGRSVLPDLTLESVADLIELI